MDFIGEGGTWLGRYKWILNFYTAVTIGTNTETTMLHTVARSDVIIGGKSSLVNDNLFSLTFPRFIRFKVEYCLTDGM